MSATIVAFTPRPAGGMAPSIESDSVHQEIVTIDENVMRHELSPAERAQQTARRKELYEALHPETAHGGDRRSSSRQNGDLKCGAFTKATAAATGQSERNIQRDARRGEALGDALAIKFADHFLPVCQASVDLLEADEADFEARCRRMLDADGTVMIEELCAEMEIVGRQMQILVDGLELTRGRLRTAMARLAETESTRGNG